MHSWPTCTGVPDSSSRRSAGSSDTDFVILDSPFLSTCASSHTTRSMFFFLTSSLCVLQGDQCAPMYFLLFCMSMYEQANAVDS